MEYHHSEALTGFVERMIGKKPPPFPPSHTSLIVFTYLHHTPGFEHCEAMDDNKSFRSYAATSIKHMCLLLDFARERDLISDESDTVRKAILYVQHYHRAVRAFQTLAASHHQAFVVPRVRFGPRRWFIQVMVHDVRSDCVIVGRTGNLDDLGSKLDDPGKCGVLQGIWLCCYWENGWLTLLLCSEVDYSDLPPDPLKICIPKAASILM